MASKKDIETLIVQPKKSNLKNHWNDAFFYNTTKYSGEIKPKELLLWRSSHFLRGAYPIFLLTFDQDGELKGIKTEKNPYHKLLDKIKIGSIVVMISGVFITMDVKLAMIATVVISVITFLLRVLLSTSAKYETKLLTAELKESIEHLELENNPELGANPKQEFIKERIEKEGAFKKVLTRLILYPFCGLICWFSITEFLPEGRVVHGIFGVIVSLAYPITDVLLMIGKTKKNQQ